MPPHESHSTPALERRLSAAGGAEYWRSLDELAGSPDFLTHLHREFPEGASEWIDSKGRRRFLKLMGASLALAGVQGCVSGPPKEDIVPYVDEAEDIVPGRPSFYATSFPFRGCAQGVLVESHNGRPTKIEGNPDHPASLGGTNVFSQASVLDLYDPGRSRTVRFRGETATADRFYAALEEEMRRFRQNGGRGLRILTERVTSPTLGAQLRALLTRFPQAAWHVHEAVSGNHVEAGLEMIYGQPRVPIYAVENADVILALDSDFLFSLAGSLRYGRMWSGRRRVSESSTEMNRLYAVESTVSITGAMADHRLPLPPSKVELVARAVAARLGVASDAGGVGGVEDAWLSGVVGDLRENGGRSLVIAGEAMPPEIHALAHRMNERLGNLGETVHYVEPVDERPPAGRPPSFEALVADMKAGAVDALVILGGNPVYTAPADLEFKQALLNVPMSAHLSMHRDETSFLSRWHVPRTHYLEGWSDLKAFDGTAGIVQPLIAPLYDTCMSDHEFVSAMLGNTGAGAYELVRTTWRARLPGDFERAWDEALRLGVIPDTGFLATAPPAPGVSAVAALADTLAIGQELAPGDTVATGREPPPRDTVAIGQVSVPGDTLAIGQESAPRDTVAAPVGASEISDTTVERSDTAAASRETPIAAPTSKQDLEVVFRPDPSIWDGRYATNHWLQELPKPITKLVWDNAVLVAPDLAEREGLENEQVVELSFDGRTVRGPVWLVPGHPDHTVTLYLGYGRVRAGDQASGHGVNAYLLRTTHSSWTARGATLRAVDERQQLVSTQHHHSMEGRHLVEEANIERFRENPNFIHEGKPIELSTLLPDYDYPRNKWGMAIDLNVCIGCNACIAACQAENNIPVVGKNEVRRGREMHWLRVDRYYKGSRSNPEAFFQPVPCMHCEKAPCEVVCPVYATVHDSEGLNVMVYNRCIGTRYCSNNCPYKVRRFNFLQYSDWTEDARALQKNPDVTVRSRGVMEKCTYCIQRISAARIRAKKEDRPIREGEVKTACQMACPTAAIAFGDLANEESHVHHLEKQPHNYKLLHKLGTRPRTSYLAHFRNPNSRMPEPEDAERRIGQKEKIEDRR